MTSPCSAQLWCSRDIGDYNECLKLEPALKEIFTINRCQEISGLTCRIHYNGKKPLPSEVFFFDFDSKGRQLCRKPTRLIYPYLKPGETDATTFLDRCPHSPDYMVLKGKWNGPYKDSY